MPKTTKVMSHWPKLIENLEASPLRFYEQVEDAIARRCVPDAAQTRIDWHEAGLLSDKREYLRITRGAYAFDICGAPFGTGFFVSTWLVEERDSLALWELGAAVVVGVMVSGILMGVFGFFGGLFLSVVAWLAGVVFAVDHLNRNRPGWDDFIVAIPGIGMAYQLLVRSKPRCHRDAGEAFIFEAPQWPSPLSQQMSQPPGP